jgi:hypothetical protein
MFFIDLLAAGDTSGGTLSLTSFAFRGAARSGSVSLSPAPLLPPEQPLTLHHPCAPGYLPPLVFR